MFPNARTGKPIKAGSVSETVPATSATANSPECPTKLRHTFGTHLALAAGRNLQLVADVMGHESMNATKRYAQFDGGPAAKVIGQLYGK